MAAADRTRAQSSSLYTDTHRTFSLKGTSSPELYVCPELLRNTRFCCWWRAWSSRKQMKQTSDLSFPKVVANLVFPLICIGVLCVRVCVHELRAACADVAAFDARSSLPLQRSQPTRRRSVRPRVFALNSKFQKGGKDEKHFPESARSSLESWCRKTFSYYALGYHRQTSFVRISLHVLHAGGADGKVPVLPTACSRRRWPHT